MCTHYCCGLQSGRLKELSEEYGIPLSHLTSMGLQDFFDVSRMNCCFFPSKPQLFFHFSLMGIKHTLLHQPQEIIILQ